MLLKISFFMYCYVHSDQISRCSASSVQCGLFCNVKRTISPCKQSLILSSLRQNRGGEGKSLLAGGSVLP